MLVHYDRLSPEPWFVGEPTDMLVPNVVRKSVVFIGKKDDKGDFTPLGTAFIVSEIEEQHRFVHLVTSEHVIKDYDKLYIRANLVQGGYHDFPVKYEDWCFHPDPNMQTDTVVLPTSIDRGDIIYSHTPAENLLTQELIEKHSIGVGDEVFAVGLFKNHFGMGTNLPVVRVGNIALMPEEPVYTKYCGYVDAYLVEVKSLGGISGSPVWVHMPPLRVIKGKVSEYSEQQYYLLGIMHGRFIVEREDEDVVQVKSEDSIEKDERINSGIGVVIPAERILEIIRQPDLVEQRKKIVERKRNEEGAVPASAREPSTKADNPQHREDFNRLLDAAVKGKKANPET